MRRGVLGISQGASAVAALAATVMIVAIALSAQMPPLFVVQKAAVEQAGEAEKLAGVRLSIVAVLDDGTVILSNDGATPVTLEKLYTPDGTVSLTSPITIQPGQKVSVNLGGRVDALAAALPDGRKVVLKEKPGVEIATITSSANPTSMTRITSSYRTTTTTTTTTATRTVTVTQSPTVTTVTSQLTSYTTQYTPFTVTQVAAASTRLVTSTIVTTYSYVGFQACSSYSNWRITLTLYHTRVLTPFQTTTTTTTATVRVDTQTTTSIDTQDYWTRTLYIITYITSTVPSLTTVTSTTTYTEITWSPVYSTYYSTAYSGFTGVCSNWFLTWHTTTRTITGTAVSATVSTTTVS